MISLPTSWWLPLLGGAVFYCLAREISKTWRARRGKPIPGPRGWPLIGNALELASSDSTGIITVYRRWAERYGPVVQFDTMGIKQVVLSDGQIASDLFVKRGNKYSNRGAPHAVEYISMNQSPGFRPKDEGWRRQRALMQSAVNITAVNQCQGLMDSEATFTLQALLHSPLAFDDQLLRYAYSVLTSSMLGFSIRSASDPFIRHNEDFTAEIMNSFRPDCFPTNVFPMLKHLPSWLVTSLARMERLRVEYSDQMWSLRRKIEQSVKDGSATDSMYKHFLLNRADYAVTEEESVHAFQGMIDGGTRSPHNNLLTLFYLMMEYPQWQAKLQEEVDRVVGSARLPTYEDIPNLPTVRAIVKEGVRYRSIVAEMGISHQLEQDDKYDGYFFEGGTIFHAIFASILTDKAVYPDGQLFNPARWLEPGYPTYKEPLSVYPNCVNYEAFGYGRRACVGTRFAERSLVILLAKLGWAANIRWPLDQHGNEARETLKFEPVPAPRPLKFGCHIQPRSPGRLAVVQKAGERLDFD